MKKCLLQCLLFALIFTSANAQLKKNGQPDMRYSANKAAASSYSPPSYSTPSSNSVGYQNSYTKKNGTYVDGSYHTKKNETNTDNYSTKPNLNPFKGIFGKRAKDYSAEAQNYGKGYEIHKGLFGGQYYRNEQGKKIYVPKR